MHTGSEPQLGCAIFTLPSPSYICEVRPYSRLFHLGNRLLQAFSRWELYLFPVLDLLPVLVRKGAENCVACHESEAKPSVRDDPASWVSSAIVVGTASLQAAMFHRNFRGLDFGFPQSGIRDFQQAI